jgi:HlyD family secretion protein
MIRLTTSAGLMSRSIRATAVHIAAVAVLFTAAACAKKQDTTVAVATAPVERRDITVTAEATGAVEPINIVEVKSKASGLITRMPVDVGSNVKPGDLLVQIDTHDVQSQYDQTVAALRAAQAQLDVAAAQKKRSDALLKEEVITPQEHETATLQYANAQAALVKARTDADIARQRLEDATVRAPVAGTVIDKPVSLGQVITSATSSASGGTTILSMADLSKVRMRALVNETDIGQVQPGQQATVTVDAFPNRRFRGVVEKVEPQAVVQQSVTMFPVLISLDNSGGELLPGMNGQVSMLVTQKNGVVAIPADAARTMRELPAAAQALGLNVDSVRAQMQTQFASAGGGRGQGSGAGVVVAAGDVAAGQPVSAANDSGRARRRAGTDGTNGTAAGATAAGATAGQTGGNGGRRSRNAGAGVAAVPNGGTGIGSGTGGGRGGSGGGTSVVFVKDGNKFTPRVVRLGATDFDYTEVLSGLKPGEQVALLGAATLQAQRQQTQDRIRSATSGGLPGTTGGAAAGGAARGRGP